MIKLTSILALATAFCLTACQTHTNARLPTSSSIDLPPGVGKFQTSIAAMNANEVLAAATAEFGQPSRDIGSGLSIPQWDIADGVLTIHPLTGPTFRKADGRVVWLMPTTNPVRDNLLQGFKMTTRPDPQNHGTRFWIGNVQITTHGAYRYTDSGSNLRDRGDQSGNFFVKHPEGRVDIIYPVGVDTHSRLEVLGERRIASLRFIPSDGSSAFECSVASSAQARRLSIIGASFEMEAGWLNFWPN